MRNSSKKESLLYCRVFSGGASGKESTYSAREIRDSGLSPRMGRHPQEGHGNPLQYSCLENPVDRESWRDYSP